ncbi:MAG: hypothetical protein HYV07_11605 [Deltaproteobacteria bacterium]|nr:hypothetical protein [Deltaproteobacteria bacterium]
MRLAIRNAAFVRALFLVGCFGDEPTDFPLGLEPLEENRAAFPSPEPNDPHPEKLVFASLERDGLYSTHARGFIHAPVSRIWAAMLDPLVVADRRKVDELTFESFPRNGPVLSFVLHNVVHDLITVEFDITWRLSVARGSEETPEVLAMRFQKTFGSTVIKTLSGSVLVSHVDEGVASIEMIEHLEALSGGNEELVSYLGDLFASVAARAHDKPLPVYE